MKGVMEVSLQVSVKATVAQLKDSIREEVLRQASLDSSQDCFSLGLEQLRA